MAGALSCLPKAVTAEARAVLRGGIRPCRGLVAVGDERSTTSGKGGIVGSAGRVRGYA